MWQRTCEPAWCRYAGRRAAMRTAPLARRPCCPGRAHLTFELGEEAMGFGMWGGRGGGAEIKLKTRNVRKQKMAHGHMSVVTAGLKSVHKHFRLNNRKGQTLKTLINHQRLGVLRE